MVFPSLHFAKCLRSQAVGKTGVSGSSHLHTRNNVDHLQCAKLGGDRCTKLSSKPRSRARRAKDVLYGSTRMKFVRALRRRRKSGHHTNCENTSFAILSHKWCHPGTHIARGNKYLSFCTLAASGYPIEARNSGRQSATSHTPASTPQSVVQPRMRLNRHRKSVGLGPTSRKTTCRNANTLTRKSMCP